MNILWGRLASSSYLVHAGPPFISLVGCPQILRRCCVVHRKWAPMVEYINFTESECRERKLLTEKLLVWVLESRLYLCYATRRCYPNINGNDNIYIQYTPPSIARVLRGAHQITLRMFSDILSIFIIFNVGLDSNFSCRGKLKVLQAYHIF